MRPMLAKINSLIQTSGIFCVVRWPDSRRKANATALLTAEHASMFETITEGKLKTHFVAFAKNMKDAKLCAHFLNKVKTLDYECFIAGEPQKIDWRLINIVQCYADALATSNHEAYCCVEHECDSHTKGGDTTKMIVPCRDLAPFLLLSRETNTPIQDQIEATAREKKQYLCPLFHANKFKLLLEQPKRYW